MKLVPVESSMIKAVFYQEDANALFVEFKNESLYCYKQVDKEIYANLLTSESKGKFFNTNIKEKYPFVKV